MAKILVIALLAVGAQAHAHSGRDEADAKDSVVQKVVTMLQENKLKVMEDLKQEEKEMAQYSQFCDDESDAKTESIKSAKRKADDLNAAIDDAAAQTRALSDEVATLGSEIAGKEADVSGAHGVRTKEKASFVGTEKSLVSSVDALEKAIVLVKRGAGFLQTGASKPGAKAFARQLAAALKPVIDAAWVDKGSAVVLKGFLQDRDAAAATAGDDLQLHRASAKSGTGGGILATLEDMKEKAQETLSSARMSEMKGNHNFQMMTQSLKDGISLSQGKLSDAKSTTASLAESSGKAQGELAEVKKTKMADMNYLHELKKDCEAAASGWADRQKSANGEIAAIEKAKEILSSRVKVLTQLSINDPYDGAPEDDSDQASTRHRLVDQLQTLGHKFNSYAMMEMASAAAEDPFTKIRGLIEDMVAKLVTEANEEASQQAFCDEEKAKSKKELDDKSMRSDDLRSRLDTANSQKETLQQGIKDLQAQLAEIDQSNGQATNIRNEEHATYVKASADYKNAASAVEEAIRVLKEYYSSQALIQVSKNGPAFAQVKGDAASTIVSILETAAEDFSRMATQVETNEQENKDTYKRLIDDNKSAKAAKTEQVRAAESEIKSLNVALQGDGEDLKMVTKELDAVMGYLEKLKPQCETKAMTYEEKRAKRQQEIEGLKEALAILDAPSAAALTQTKTAPRLRAVSKL